MGRLLLKDTTTGSMLNCMLWEERLNQHSPKTFKPGNILRIISATQNPNYNNCTLENVKLIKEAIQEEANIKTIIAIILPIPDLLSFFSTLVSSISIT